MEPRGGKLQKRQYSPREKRKTQETKEPKRIRLQEVAKNCGTLKKKTSSLLKKGVRGGSVGERGKWNRS